MKSKILGLLAVGLMAGPMAAKASYLYEFNPTAAGAYISFTLPTIVTTTGSLGLPPFALSGFTITRSEVFAGSNGNLCFLFATADFVGDCENLGGGSLTRSYFPNPSAIGTYGNVGGTVNSPPLEVLRTLRISFVPDAVPEPGTLALLGLGLLGLGVTRRKAA